MALSEFGKLVRTKRIHLGMTLGTMAAKLNVSSAVLSAVETGRKPVPINWIDSVAEILNLSELEVKRITSYVRTSHIKKQAEIARDEEFRLVAAVLEKKSEMSGEQLDLFTSSILAYASEDGK